MTAQRYVIGHFSAPAKDTRSWLRRLLDRWLKHPPPEDRFPVLAPSTATLPMDRTWTFTAALPVRVTVRDDLPPELAAADPPSHTNHLMPADTMRFVPGAVDAPRSLRCAVQPPLQAGGLSTLVATRCWPTTPRERSPLRGA